MCKFLTLRLIFIQMQRNTSTNVGEPCQHSTSRQTATNVFTGETKNKCTAEFLIHNIRIFPCQPPITIQPRTTVRNSLLKLVEPRPVP